jgi:Uma2 family endonuclease
VVQPDICMICNPEILDEKGCNGVPYLIIEILSPATSVKDSTIKFDLYEEVGVKEYWMVYPELNLVDVFVLTKTGNISL